MHRHLAILVAVGATAWAAPAVAADPNELVEIVPVVRATRADAAILAQNNELLMKNQAQVIALLKHLGIAAYQPVLPKLHLMSSNSVQALVNQMDYRALARRLDVEPPTNFQAPSGGAIQNHHFHHLYNNTLLRAIADKVGVAAPARIEEKGSVAFQGNLLIRQNGELLTLIGRKLGASM